MLKEFLDEKVAEAFVRLLAKGLDLKKAYIKNEEGDIAVSLGNPNKVAHFYTEYCYEFDMDEYEYMLIGAKDDYTFVRIYFTGIKFEGASEDTITFKIGGYYFTVDSKEIEPKLIKELGAL